VYSFLICTSILRNAGAIDEAIWNIFLRGPTVFSAAEKAAALDSPDLLVCNKLSWDTVRSAELRSKGQFEGLTADICEKWESEWKEWAQGDNPAAAKLPGDWSEKLDAFDKLILVRAFRLEQVTLALTDYVVRAQGRFYVEAVSSAMDIVFPQLNVYTPMIFVLTQGSDPTAILLSFAAAMNFADKLHPISLGQGQGEKAAKLIKASCAAGDWVML
jgi:dynein heavy chain